MCGGGKGVQQTSMQQSYPSWPAAMMYGQASGMMGQLANTPFQKYSSDPNAYVAPINATQRGAIGNITGMAGMTDPYYQAARGMTERGSAGVGRLTADQIGEYMSPYMAQVVDPVKAALNQKFGEQLSKQQAEAVRSGAFGGSRSDVNRALLEQQQGLALGQALSPLYQQGYGHALQTAMVQQGIEAQNLQRLLGAGAQMGHLGSAAQQAALQQAMAQLQGGTLEQQTGTAGLQALYNEFQKQRMWPLQIAQMYGQMAGALGPLMGSGSSGYQQMPFFGALATGGSVDKYGEGLGKARLGGGVTGPGDYARGGYAGGGDIDLAGLVAQQKAALGLGMPQQDIPFPTGEIRASQPLDMGSLPERKPGIVGQALRSAISDPSGTYEKAKGLGSSLKTGYNFLTNGPGSLMGFADGGDVHNDAMQALLSNPIQASKPPEQQQPQQQKSGLGGLLKAGASLAANTFLPGSGAVVNAGLGALGMAHGGRAGYEDGGDIFESGILGAESRKRQFDREGHVLTSPKGALGIAQIMPTTAPEAARLAGLPYDEGRLRSDPEYNKALGHAYYNEQLRKFGTPELAAAAYNAGPGAVQKALQRAQATGRDVMSFLPAETRDYVPRVMRMGGHDGVDAARDSIASMRREIPLGDPRRDMMAMYPDRPTTESTGPAAGLGSAQVKDKSFFERTQEHPESLILPVLQGLGAMAGSRNKFLGSAILEGLGAGAGSYMDMAAKQSEIDKRRQETATEAEETARKRAEIGQIGATTGLLTAETGEKIQSIAGGAFKTVGDETFVLTDKGYWLNIEQWRKNPVPLIGGAPAAEAARSLPLRTGPPSAAAGAPPPAAGVPATTPEGTAPGTAAAGAKQPSPMPPTTPVNITPGVVWSPEAENLAQNEYGKFTGPGSPAMKARSAQYLEQTTQGADIAIATRPVHADVAKIIAQAATQKGLNTPGIGFTATSGIIGALNRIANAVGVPGDVFGGARTQNDLSDKLNGISGRLATSEAGQRSLGALQSTIQTMPDLDKTAAAAAENAADNIMNNQRSIDRLAHMRKYGSISNNRFSDADTAFNASNPSVKYGKERDAIRDLILGKVPTPEGARKDVRKAHEILDKMYDPKVPSAAIDKFFKEHYKLDNMSRYFR